MTADPLAEFGELTELVGRVLTRNFPTLTWAIVITDGELVNLASNAPAIAEVAELLEAADDQLKKQGGPSAA
jgi:hypothetical protein